MKHAIAALYLVVFLAPTGFSQILPDAVAGELYILTQHPPGYYELDASVELVGMGFGGVANGPRRYSNVFTNDHGDTAPITGGTHTFSNEYPAWWALEHIEKNNPDVSNVWVGFGLYKITIGFCYFYLDYLDSQYPYSGSADIWVFYDFSQVPNHIHVQHRSPDYDVYPVNGQVIRVWADLFGQGDNPVGTAFYLHGNVPVDPNKSSDQLFTQVIVDGNVTVPVGKTFTVDRNAYPNPNVLQALGLRFSASTSLLVSGILYVNGNSGSRISLTSNGGTTPGSWGSIVINGSGTNGSSIKYANIQYGTQIDVTSASNVTVSNCSITNNSNIGINVYNSSNFLALGNTITNTDTLEGIKISGGSNNTCDGNVIYKTDHNRHSQIGGIWYNATGGTITRNDIAWYSYGIEISGGSSPTSWMGQSPPVYRNNRVMNCYLGFYVYGQSYPCCFGVIADSRYGYNSIYSNIPYCAWVEGGSSLLAHQNYWGSSPGFWGPVDHSFPLSIDPWLNIPPRSMQPGTTPSNDAFQLLASITKTPTSSLNQVSNECEAEQTSGIDSLLIGIELRDQGKFEEAKDFFMSYLSKDPKNQAAYACLYGCADSGTTPSIIDFFKSLPAEAAKEHKLLLPYLYLRQGDVASAKQVNNSIIDANSNTALGVRAELSNFYIFLYVDNDQKTATSILKEVRRQASLLTEAEISSAENALITYVDPKTGKMPNYGSEKYSDGGTSSVPEVDGITGNYPNPFNPSTQIRFAVKRGGLVSLKVFDLLGREVAVLVNEVKSPGTYNVIWNASQVASGIYFARFESAGRVAIHKLLYLK